MPLVQISLSPFVIRHDTKGLHTRKIKSQYFRKFRPTNFQLRSSLFWDVTRRRFVVTEVSRHAGIYRPTLRNIPEERRSSLHRGWSLKLCKFSVLKIVLAIPILRAFRGDIASLNNLTGLQSQQRADLLLHRIETFPNIEVHIMKHTVWQMKSGSILRDIIWYLVVK